MSDNRRGEEECKQSKQASKEESSKQAKASKQARKTILPGVRDATGEASMQARNFLNAAKDVREIQLPFHRTQREGEGERKRQREAEREG
jgi:hypothetical protein